MVGRGRPSGETPKSVINHIRSLAPSILPNEDPHPNFVSSSVLNKLLCCICYEVAASPISLSCGEIICSHCCCKSIQISYTLKCPCCFSHSLSTETISSPSHLFMSLLTESPVSCIRGCGKTIKLEDYQRHLNSRCKSFAINADSPSKVTLKDVFNKPTTTPPTPTEVKTAQHLIRRLIHHGNSDSNASGVIKVPTSGQVRTHNYFKLHCLIICLPNMPTNQPITLMKVPGCRISSSDASSRTVKRRIEVLETIREVTSGGDSTSQLAAEVNHLSKVQRQVQLPLVISADHALAMKADLAIPWAKLRVLRR